MNVQNIRRPKALIMAVFNHPTVCRVVELSISEDFVILAHVVWIQY